MTTSTGRVLVFAAVSEQEWQTLVIKWAKGAGWLVSHQHDSRLQEWGTDRGVPDLILVRPPRVLLVELKRERGYLSRYQAVWLAALRACPGVEAVIWRPSMEVEVREALA